MKAARSIAVLCAVGGMFVAIGAQAKGVPEKAMTCAEAAQQYQLTAEAKERFAQLQGSCEAIYRIDGALYAHTHAIVRSVRGDKVTIYLPATDRTFDVTPGPDARVELGGTKVRPRDLKKGDKLGIYLSLDRFAEDKLTEVAISTEKLEVEATPIEQVAATEVKTLPTTASPLPALGLLSSLLLGVGFVARRIRRSA